MLVEEGAGDGSGQVLGRWKAGTIGVGGVNTRQNEKYINYVSPTCLGFAYSEEKTSSTDFQRPIRAL